jgi:type IV secretion system protein VirB8
MIGFGGAGFGVLGCLAAAAVALSIKAPLPVVVPYDPETGMALPNATVVAVSLAERPAVIEAQIYR